MRSDGDWAQMIEHAQGVVARHPEFAFGHSLLAAAYAEASDSIDVPDRAQAMSDAARREANLTLKLDPQDAGAYAILSGSRPVRLSRAGSDFAARHQIRKASQSSRLAHYTRTRARCSAMSGVCAKPCPSNWSRMRPTNGARQKRPSLRALMPTWGTCPRPRDWIQKGGPALAEPFGRPAGAAVHRRLLRTAVRRPRGHRRLDAQASARRQAMRFGGASSKPGRRIPSR